MPVFGRVRQRKLNAFEKEDQRGQALLAVDDIVNAILCGSNVSCLFRSMADYGRHKMVLICAARRQLHKIFEKILPLSSVPAVEALVMWNAEHAVCK